jgi:hypothetical protein
MGWKTFWAIFLQTHLVTLMQTELLKLKKRDGWLCEVTSA